MNYQIEKNSDRYSEFSFVWLVIENDKIIADGLACSYELAEIDAKNYMKENQNDE